MSPIVIYIAACVAVASMLVFTVAAADPDGRAAQVALAALAVGVCASGVALGTLCAVIVKHFLA